MPSLLSNFKLKKGLTAFPLLILYTTMLVFNLNHFITQLSYMINLTS